jgi:hypothetical protein
MEGAEGAAFLFRQMERPVFRSMERPLFRSMERRLFRSMEHPLSHQMDDDVPRLRPETTLVLRLELRLRDVIDRCRSCNALRNCFVSFSGHRAHRGKAHPLARLKNDSKAARFMGYGTSQGLRIRQLS